MIYSLYTLADITATKQYHGGEKLERNQQQNFDTVLQTIQLCGNLYYKNPPVRIPADIFGRPDIDCWYFEWSMEINDLFLKNNDQIAVIKELIEHIPYISELTEAVQFTPSVFKLGHNIIFDFKQ
jgi:hypothetical protein